MARKLRFENFHFSDGFWDSTFVSLEILYASSQVIHSVVRQQGKQDWLLTAVYASPVAEVRRRLWDHLENFSSDVSWLMFGDFNDVYCSNEKFGGSVVSITRCLRFSNMMDVCGMVDLGFQGPAYTWTNMRSSGK